MKHDSKCCTSVTMALVALAISSVGVAAEVFPLPPQATAVVTNAAAVMEAKVFNGADGGTMRYRILSPATLEAGRRYPLVLFFHGAGERGDDNAMQLLWGVWPIISYMKQKGIEGYVIAPVVMPHGTSCSDAPTFSRRRCRCAAAETPRLRGRSGPCRYGRSTETRTARFPWCARGRWCLRCGSATEMCATASILASATAVGFLRMATIRSSIGSSRSRRLARMRGQAPGGSGVLPILSLGL